MWCAADGGGVLKDLETAFSLMAWPTNYMETLLEFETRVLRPFGAAPHTALVSYMYMGERERERENVCVRVYRFCVCRYDAPLVDKQVSKETYYSVKRDLL